MKQLALSPRIVFSLLLGLMLLAACTGSGEAPTSTPTVEVLASATTTPDPSAEPTVISPFGTLPPARTDAPVIGPSPEMTGVDDGSQPGGRGTLVAVGTINPDLPTGFDRIVLVRTGGPLNDQGQTLDETIIIERNGAMTRNGAAGTVSSGVVEQIGSTIDSINFFATQSNFVGPIPLEGPQPYMYQILVVKGFNERLITAQDGMMPSEIEGLIAAILTEGFKIDRP